MRRKLLFLALPALALTCLLAIPESSYAQRYGFGGGRGGGWGGGWGGGRGIGVGNGYYGSGYGNGYYGSGYGNGYYGNRGWGSQGYYGSNYYGSGYNYSPYYGSGYSYTPGYTYSQPYYGDSVVQGYAGTPTTSAYQSFYPPNSNQAPDQNRATIRVQVPAGAQVMFNGTQTTQSGPQRVFMTPPLNPGEGYSYEIAASWNENGQPKSQTRTVRFQAGQSVDVDFMQAQNQQFQGQPNLNNQGQPNLNNQGQQNLNNQGQQFQQTQPLQQQQPQVQPQQVQPQQQQQPLKQASPRDLP